VQKPGEGDEVAGLFLLAATMGFLRRKRVAVATSDSLHHGCLFMIARADGMLSYGPAKRPIVSLQEKSDMLAKIRSH
jgi:hypothetical protein